MIANAVENISFPTWAEVCDKTNATCSASWQETVGAK